MVETYQTGNSPRDSEAGSRRYQAERISRGTSPTSDVESRPSHALSLQPGHSWMLLRSLLPPRFLGRWL